MKTSVFTCVRERKANAKFSRFRLHTDQYQTTKSTTVDTALFLTYNTHIRVCFIIFLKINLYTDTC